MIVTLGIYEILHNGREDCWVKDSTSASDFLEKVGAPVDIIQEDPFADAEQMRRAVSDTFWPGEQWDETESPYLTSDPYDPNRSSTSYHSRGSGTMYNAWS